MIVKIHPMIQILANLIKSNHFMLNKTKRKIIYFINSYTKKVKIYLTFFYYYVLKLICYILKFLYQNII